MKCFLLSVFALVIVLYPRSTDADFMTFNVDLSGIGSSGHLLSVFGTMTVDPDLDVGSAVQSSSLTFRHVSNVVFTVSLPTIPEYVLSFDNLDWEVDGGNLYVTRIGDGLGGIRWQEGDFPNGLGELILGSGQQPHSLAYVTDGKADIFDLKPASGPDGMNGFLVGTSPIPEPSCVVLLGLAGTALSVRRRSRK